MRHGAGEFFPVKEFVEAAYEIGVKRVTVGNDTHIPKTLGYRISDPLRAYTTQVIGELIFIEAEKASESIYPI
jgi:hypothetical protein